MGCRSVEAMKAFLTRASRGGATGRLRRRTGFFRAAFLGAGLFAADFLREAAAFFSAAAPPAAAWARTSPGAPSSANSNRIRSVFRGT